MKIILLQDIGGTGRRGEIREVADGYARNFLLPRKLAAAATPEVLRKAAALAAERVTEQAARTVAVEGEIKKLGNVPLQWHEKASEEGELYGSLTAKEIEELLRSHGIIHVRAVRAPHIKALGDHAVELDFGDGIKKTVTVTVLRAD